MRRILRWLNRLLCGFTGHVYRMRCENTTDYPWSRLVGWQCDICGKWAR